MKSQREQVATKNKSARKDAEPQKTRKDFLCVAFASSRLCVKVFAFFARVLPRTAYCAILSARFRMLLQYRAAAFAGFVTQLFWGLIRVMIFSAFYRSSNAPQPMT